MLRKVAFTMYPVLGINRAKSFYEKDFGLTPTKASANGSWLEYDLPGGGCFAITSPVCRMAVIVDSNLRIIVNL